jgi:hypothetical protein
MSLMFVSHIEVLIECKSLTSLIAHQTVYNLKDKFAMGNP